MATIRELGPEETHLAHPALAELRPHYPSLDDFVTRVNDVQRPEGYRLVASFGADGSAVAAAGFRLGHNLAWGRYLYVDDLVTRAESRGQGHASAVMEWLIEEARRLGCDQLHLDSGTHRKPAHRFYLTHGFDISSFHFDRKI